jgi:hypothetical protein
MQSSTKGFELIIFDGDGVLVDNPVWRAPHGFIRPCTKLIGKRKWI